MRNALKRFCEVLVEVSRKNLLSALQMPLEKLKTGYLRLYNEVCRWWLIRIIMPRWCREDQLCSRCDLHRPSTFTTVRGYIEHPLPCSAYVLPVGPLSISPFCEAQAMSRGSFSSPCCFPDTFLFIHHHVVNSWEVLVGTQVDSWGTVEKWPCVFISGLQFNPCSGSAVLLLICIFLYMSLSISTN